MNKGQGSVSIVAILVVFVIVLGAISYYYRHDIFGPTIVNANPIIEKQTIRENNTTIIRENITTVIKDNNPDMIVINNPAPNVENNVFINNTFQNGS